MSASNSQQSGLASLGLQQRLLEVAVVVGMDEVTGLQIRQNNNPADSSSLFNCNFKGHLLDILSGPQDITSSGSEVISSSWKALRQLTTKRNNPPSAPKPKPLHRGQSVRKLRKKANKHEEVPVSTDFLSNMPYLCLPDESKAHEVLPESTIHCTVLTDIDGCRHYAVILTFFKEFHATKSGEASWNLETKLKSSPSKGSENDRQSCFLPWCICFVSLKPYFSVLKDALSCFHKELTGSPLGNWRKLLEKYVTNLSLAVCPPPSIKIRFTIGSLPIILTPPPYPSKQDNIIDIDLRLPLFIFMKEPTVLLKVLACIMHEQRIVFFSSNHTLLPLVMECFRSYISPMEWHHQYIPILFSEIIGFVDCPGIFMMGCHSRHRNEIEKVENDLFFVDLDQATIYTNSTTTKEADGGVLGQFALHMPTFAVQNLLKRLTDFELHNSVSSVCEVNPVTLEEMREHNLKIRQHVNKKIRNVFTEFMVDIFGSSMLFLDHEHHQFKENKFLESINPTDMPFYIKVSKSYMFRRFIRQRLTGTNDDFKKVADRRTARKLSARNARTRPISESISSPNLRDEPRPKSSSLVKRTSSSRLSFKNQNGNENAEMRKTVDSIRLKSAENGDLFSRGRLYSDHFADPNEFELPVAAKFNGTKPSEVSSEITLTLPAFPVQGTNFNAKHFYERCVRLITDTIENKVPSNSDALPEVASHRAALLLMRGLYELAAENLVKGFQDLQATAKEDARFFPDKLLKKIALSLNQTELARIQQHSLYISVPMKSKAQASRTQSVVTHQMRSFFLDDNTALYSLKKEPLTFILEKTDVTTDEKAISNLFHALCSCSDSSATEIEPECFNAFYQTWQQAKSDCRKALKSFSSDVRLPPEVEKRRLSSNETNNTDQFLNFHSDEEILKISGTVLSNKGNGRLLLTTRRIIFVSAGNQECKAIINLEDVLSVREGKLKNFLTSTVALYVIHQNAPVESNSPLKIGLKNHTTLWMHLVNEIRTGRITSREQRDDNLALSIASQNVFLADAFCAAACDEKYMKPEQAMEWVAKLCKFESIRESGEMMVLTPETKDMMAMRMDPCPKESKKAGICAMAYSSAGINETPRIWLALSSGKLRVIDTTTWYLDTKPIKEWDTKPNCICIVDGKELWIGGQNSNIYVLSVATMHVTRILHDHADAVVFIISLPNGLVGSATGSGEIIIWSPDPAKVQKKFNAFVEPLNLVGFTPFNEKLCCCSTLYVGIYDYDGNLLQRLEPGDSPTIMESNMTCCAWENDVEIWAGDDRGAIYSWDVMTGRRRSSSLSSFSKHKDLIITQPKLAGVISEEAGVTCMMKHEGKLWVGNSIGEIIIFNTAEPKQECTLKANEGSITSLCRLENRYMVSGSGDDDGKLVLWTQLKSLG